MALSEHAQAVSDAIKATGIRAADVVAPQFVTKDSGARDEWESGMQRDTEDGKPRFDLTQPLDVPYEHQMFTRFAKLMGRGAVKYGDRNWEKGNSVSEMLRARSSAFRHFMQWFFGMEDEDHASAVWFNIQAVERLKYVLRKQESEGV